MMKKFLITLSFLALVVSSCKKQTESLEIVSQNDITETPTKTEEIDNTKFKAVALQQQFSKLDGSSIAFEEILKQHEGKVILIDVWASWCPDCLTAFPSIQDIKTNFPEIVSVNLSLDKTTEAWKEAIGKYDIKGEHYFLGDDKRMKSDFGQAIELNWIPRYIIVDKNGDIALFHATEKDFTDIDNTLRNLQ